MSEIVVDERSAASLVGQFVQRQSSKAGGKISLGYFYATCDEDLNGGWVFDFATKRQVETVVSLCRVVPKWKVSGGVNKLPVKIPLFGEGEIIEEFMSQGQLRVRVRLKNSSKTMLVNFTAVELVVPPRG